MSYAITWVIEGDKQISRNLKIMADRVRDWTPAFQETALSLKSIFSQDVFASQGGAIEEKWPALSPAYALRKARLYPGKGILERTGAMKGSFQTLWRPDMAQVWNDVQGDYFKYHQSNQDRTSNLPRRVMIKLADAQRTLVVRIFNTYFQEMIGRS